MGSSGANIEIQPGERRIEGGKYGTKATNIRIEPAKMVVEEIKYLDTVGYIWLI